MGFLGWLGISALFYAAAEYEHMTGWKWALASFGISATIDGLFPFSFVFALPGQFALFLIMWWANTRRLAALEVDREAGRDADRQLRHERARLAREQVDPARAAQEAEREAKAEADAAERRERVRLAREAREQEERERAATESQQEPPPGS